LVGGKGYDKGFIQKAYKQTCTSKKFASQNCRGGVAGRWKTELIDVKTLDYAKRIYRITVKNEELDTVWATIQLTHTRAFGNEGYLWKLLDLEWEGER
jgi:hypothetical protein